MIGEAASASQEATDRFQMPLRKSWKRKDICLNKFLMPTSVLFWVFFFFKCLIRKEEKQAVGFKAERDRLTIANTVGFMIKTALVHWRRQWRPTPVLLPGKSHGQRSLAGCSPWGR